MKYREDLRQISQTLFKFYCVSSTGRSSITSGATGNPFCSTVQINYDASLAVHVVNGTDRVLVDGAARGAVSCPADGRGVHPERGELLSCHD